MPSHQWYVKRGEQVAGPISSEKLIACLQSRRVLGSDQVRAADRKTWVTVGQVPGLKKLADRAAAEAKVTPPKDREPDPTSYDLKTSIRDAPAIPKVIPGHTVDTQFQKGNTLRDAGAPDVTPPKLVEDQDAEKLAGFLPDDELYDLRTTSFSSLDAPRVIPGKTVPPELQKGNTTRRESEKKKKGPDLIEDDDSQLL